MDAALRDHAARSWPPAEAHRVDGWLLRSTPGIPRGRLNSALPLRPDPELAPVLAFYAQRGQPAAVQLTPIDGHPRLRAQLDAAGWGSRWSCAVMRAPVREAPAPSEVALLERPEPRWLDAWSACEGRARADVAEHARTVLAQLDGRAAYALVEPADAVGLAVAEAERCGLFCIAVAAARRRAGLGSAVVRALLAWARRRGACEAYLEVERRNAPALAMYERLGFTTAYHYVHRIAPA